MPSTVSVDNTGSAGVKVNVPGGFRKWLLEPDSRHLGARFPANVAALPPVFAGALHAHQGRVCGTGRTYEIELPPDVWDEIRLWLASLVDGICHVDILTCPDPLYELARVGAPWPCGDAATIADRIDRETTAWRNRPTGPVVIEVTGDSDPPMTARFIVENDSLTPTWEDPDNIEAIAVVFGGRDRWKWWADRYQEVVKVCRKKRFAVVNHQRAAELVAAAGPDALTGTNGKFDPTPVAVWSRVDCPVPVTVALWAIGVTDPAVWKAWAAIGADTPALITAWTKAKVRTANQANQWRAAGAATPAEVSAWAAVGVTSPVILRNWSSVGVTSPQHLLSMRSAGITTQKKARAHPDEVLRCQAAA